MREFVTRHFRSVAFLLVGLVCGAALTTGAFAYQSHMVNARNSLHTAWNQLNAAVPDKAGHRVNAMNLVQQAITQVNQGITAGAH